MVVISLSIPDDLLGELDSVLGSEWYASRSEVVRQAVRKYISEYRELEEIDGEVIATVTALYERMGRNGNDELLQLEHEFEDILTTYLHSHITEKSCLEVMVVRGPSARLKELVDGLKANRRIKQLKLSVMAVG